ncbi:glycosyl hydrolase family 85-domain-containing protein [Mycena alexandri]|uniref:Glycosyl hydrolase family 85-domain-containing protein n=1 Tax=Mycena alexandri TaxID=1745969 RepID=A0AAD6SNI2_9AGAR|nr:glycosyl hydrolase family 85-domain-containing protein [Mycena alexandri]
MPLTGNSFGDLGSSYFKTLEDLDLWAAKPMKVLDAVLEYVPRPPSSNTRGKLLVCHDYKGGYTESPFSLGYTFNFWSAADVFIYFSHHRVTVPPPGWITAAHRQGVKMLGTLIFEGSGEDDCLRLLVGRLPKSKTGPARQPPNFRSLPLSPHYARVLADLAHQRGFDGYLLNFECPLRGGIEQTRAVAAWITLLVDEMKSKIGPHAEAIWYDSVVVTGQLAWQDRLNSFNLPFFLSSTSFFTNYTWPPSYPTKTVEYFRSLSQTATHVAPKTLHDIYVGIDVFGRGSHGGGGFGAYKALEHIAPAGLSTAFFGQGWTWENTQDAPGFTWESWFADDRRLWAGPRAGEHVVVPTATPNRPGEPACVHGAFAAVGSFFAHSAPPDPRSLPLHTTFCPGVGRTWWVDGVRVFQRPGRDGWTDIDKQTSVGDLVWPVPLLAWEGDDSRTDVLPAATSEITLNEAWNGGSALRLGISAPGEEGEDAAFRCVWVPVQIEQEDANVDLDIALSIKVTTSLSTYSDAFDIAPQSVSSTSLPGGWTKLCIRFESSTPLAEPTLKAALGLVVSIIAEDPSQPLKLSLLLGQLNAYPSPGPTAPSHAPMLLWADFDTAKSLNAPLDGTLSWEVASTFLPLPTLTLSGAEDANSAWPLAPSAERWFPRFMYFNIYAQRHGPGAAVVQRPEDAVWVGTSGYEGRARAFVVRQANLPFELAGVKTVTFYVQGVTDRGEILRWDQCVFIDVFLP